MAVHIIPYSYGFIHIARMGSVYITMSVTLERFFAVVYPLRNIGAKKYLLPGTSVFAIGYNVPKVRLGVYSNILVSRKRKKLHILVY